MVTEGLICKTCRIFKSNIKVLKIIWNIQPATNLDFREGQDESKTSEGTFWYFIYWTCFVLFVCVASVKELNRLMGN